MKLAKFLGIDSMSSAKVNCSSSPAGMVPFKPSLELSFELSPNSQSQPFWDFHVFTGTPEAVSGA